MNYQNQAAYGQGYQAQAPHQAAQQAATFWALDDSAAEKAGENNYIDKTGFYTATIERAEYIKATTGTHGLLVRIKAGDVRGSFILNFQKATGEKIFGADFINAMLFLAGLKGFNWATIQDEKGQLIQVAKEFGGVEMGFFLRAEKDAQGRTNLELLRVYHPRTLHTVTELKQGKAAETINRLAAELQASQTA